MTWLQRYRVSRLRSKKRFHKELSFSEQCRGDAVAAAEHARLARKYANQIEKITRQMELLWQDA